MTAMQFQGFKPQAMERIAGTLGYKGDMNNFQDFLQSDPEASAKFNNFQNKAIQMMNGGGFMSKAHAFEQGVKVSICDRAGMNCADVTRTGRLKVTD